MHEDGEGDKCAAVGEADGGVGAVRRRRPRGGGRRRWRRGELDGHVAEAGEGASDRMRVVHVLRPELRRDPRRQLSAGGLGGECRRHPRRHLVRCEQQTVAGSGIEARDIARGVGRRGRHRHARVARAEDLAALGELPLRRGRCLHICEEVVRHRLGGGAVLGKHTEIRRVRRLAGDKGATRYLVEGLPDRLRVDGLVAAVGRIVEDLLQASLVAVLERDRERGVGPVVGRGVRRDYRGDVSGREDLAGRRRHRGRGAADLRNTARRRGGAGRGRAGGGL